VFGDIRPANTLVRAEMVDPRMLVEIEADAIIATEDASA
jgi:enamine deaminase RidA (YjgF/YER057c/UK114 family)